MARFLPVSNPQSRFEPTLVEYDEGEAPGAAIEVIEDRSRSILSTNDSPDVGFRWSVNPYRGCLHACAYCLDGETPILLADGRTRPLRALRVGDAIYGTRVRSGVREYVRTRVVAHWQTMKRAHRVRLADGTELVASGDHRFLTAAGWKYVLAAEEGAKPRPHLAPGDRLVGTGAFATSPAVAAHDYERGYLCAMIRSDALGGGSVLDLEAARRVRTLLSRVRAERADEPLERVNGGAARVRERRGHLSSLGAWPAFRSPEWQRGFLAGMFDAAGSRAPRSLSIAVGDDAVVATLNACLRTFRFDHAFGHDGRRVEIPADEQQQLRFLHLTDPAVRESWSLAGQALKAAEALEVVAIEPLGVEIPMFDITTGTGDFIANGVVSHNCYARPSHEYLSLGAGTDFERKIVVKRQAAELLRESFDKKSWTGERIVFSGITDCYQPLESKLRITRACLEVCAEYRNPVGIITKSPVIERDIDILQELGRVANARVSVSIPFWDPDVSKAMEPTVTTPERRMKIVETLAKAGIPVGVSISPIVPGLNDDHLGELIERAANAGAKHTFFVLLRLPGPVKDVFEKALREKLPLRAEKVLRRLREAYGGKVYDSAFGMRGRGDGVYAEMIRKLFERTARHHGLSSDEMASYETPAATFRRPEKNGQTSFGF